MQPFLFLGLFLTSLIFSTTESLAVPVNLETQPSAFRKSNFVVVPTPRSVNIPHHPLAELGEQWEIILQSVATPSQQDEVPNTTGGLLFRVGWATWNEASGMQNDNRWVQMIMRYFTNGGLSFERQFLINSHIYEGTETGQFIYWTTAFIPLLPGQDLQHQKWYAETNSTSSFVQLLGYVNADTI